MSAIRAKSIIVTVRCLNISTNAPITGDAANITIKVIKDGVSTTSTNTVSEVDSVNAPGIYKLTLTATEMTGDSITIAGKSSTASSRIDGLQMQTVRVPDVDPGTANGLFISGTNSGGVTISNSAGSALTLSSSGSNGHGLVVSGNGTGHGISTTGGINGHGILVTGGSTLGEGIKVVATQGNAMSLRCSSAFGASALFITSSDGDALIIQGSGANNINAVNLTGVGTGAGFKCTGGSTGNGMSLNGNAPGSGLSIGGTGIGGHALSIAKSGSGNGINVSVSGANNNLINMTASGGNNLGINMNAGVIISAGGMSITNSTGDGLIITSNVLNGNAINLTPNGTGEPINATLESGITFWQAQKYISSAVAGTLAGGGTTSVSIDAIGNPGTTRISATVDASGNRSAITLT